MNWDLHSAVGFWTVSLVMMWAVTGVYFAFPTAFRSTVNRISPLTVARAPQSNPSRAGQAAAPTWRALLDEARRHAPGQFVARVVVPSSPSAAFLVMFSTARPTPVGSANLTPVYLDQFTGNRWRRRLQANAPPATSSWPGWLHCMWVTSEALA